MTNIQIPSGIIDENIELFSTTGKEALPTVLLKTFDLPLKFMETLEKCTKSSTIIALKLAGFKTREQQLEKIF
jgi:hypothetical protein